MCSVLKFYPGDSWALSTELVFSSETQKHKYNHAFQHNIMKEKIIKVT